MSEWGSLRILTIGQYLPSGSPLHRLDPRVRLLGFLLLASALMARGQLAVLLLGLLVVTLLLILARVPLRYALRGLVPLWPLFLILLAFQLLF
ncbi:MAG: energy-coupling factor transporter transmembrane component T family protein, partial [Chloroflexia bacterium]